MTTNAPVSYTIIGGPSLDRILDSLKYGESNEMPVFTEFMLYDDSIGPAHTSKWRLFITSVKRETLLPGSRIFLIEGRTTHHPTMPPILFSGIYNPARRDGSFEKID